MQHRLSLAETKVAGPSNQIDEERFNNLLGTAPARAPPQFPRFCFEASKSRCEQMMASIERFFAECLRSKIGVGKPSIRKFLGFNFIVEKACPLTARVLLQKTPPLLLRALGTETVFESQQRFLGNERG